MEDKIQQLIEWMENQIEKHPDAWAMAMDYQTVIEKAKELQATEQCITNKFRMTKLRELINLYDKDEISISKFLEEINNHFIMNNLAALPKFKGERIDNGEWVEGHYFTTPLSDENSGAPTDAGWFFLTGETRHCIGKDGIAFCVHPESVQVVATEQCKWAVVDKDEIYDNYQVAEATIPDDFREQMLIVKIILP